MTQDKRGVASKTCRAAAAEVHLANATKPAEKSSLLDALCVLVASLSADSKDGKGEMVARREGDELVFGRRGAPGGSVCGRCVRDEKTLLVMLQLGSALEESFLRARVEESQASSLAVPGAALVMLRAVTAEGVLAGKPACMRLQSGRFVVQFWLESGCGEEQVLKKHVRDSGLVAATGMSIVFGPMRSETWSQLVPTPSSTSVPLARIAAQQRLSHPLVRALAAAKKAVPTAPRKEGAAATSYTMTCAALGETGCSRKVEIVTQKEAAGKVMSNGVVLATLPECVSFGVELPALSDVPSDAKHRARPYEVYVHASFALGAAVAAAEATRDASAPTSPLCRDVYAALNASSRATAHCASFVEQNKAAGGQVFADAMFRVFRDEASAGAAVVLPVEEAHLAVVQALLQERCVSPSSVVLRPVSAQLASILRHSTQFRSLREALKPRPAVVDRAQLVQANRRAAAKVH